MVSSQPATEDSARHDGQSPPPESLETDDDLEFGTEGPPYEEPKLVDVDEVRFSVFELVRKIDRGQLRLSPEYQRLDVWKADQRSRFVESVLLNIPLPPLFLNQAIDGAYVMVDGKQRSTALYRFMKGGYALTGLSQLQRLEGSRFQDLSPGERARIEDRSLSCHVLKPTVPLKIVQEIFYRINTGGTQLNGQEIRHGLYHGRSTDLLKRIAESDIFRQTVPISETQRGRMKDHEAILRCLAFQHRDPQTDYKGDLDEFLGSTMDQFNKADDTTLERLETGFYGALARASLLGPNAYRIPTIRTRGRINVPVLESVLAFFWHLPASLAQRYPTLIQVNYKELLEDPEYRDAVRFSTGDTARVRIRFARAREILGRGVGEGNDAE